MKDEDTDYVFDRIIDVSYCVHNRELLKDSADKMYEMLPHVNKWVLRNLPSYIHEKDTPWMEFIDLHSFGVEAYFTIRLIDSYIGELTED